MRVAIFGTGAVGAEFGALLLREGNDVSFVARGAQLDAITTRGIRVQRPDDPFETGPVTASDDPAALGQADAVLLCVKAWQVEEAGARMGPLIGPSTGVVTMQNGVEAPEQLARTIGAEHVLPGIARVLAAMGGPGVVQDAGFPPAVHLAEFDASQSDRAKSIARTMTSAGIGTKVVPDIHHQMWRKLMFITSMSSVGAITRAPKGVFFEVDETRAMVEALMREIEAVGRAAGIEWAGDPVAETMEFITGLTPSATMSMQRDIMAGRPSELEAQTGVVMRKGREFGVPTPVTDVIYASLLCAERVARGQVEAPEPAFAT